MVYKHFMYGNFLRTSFPTCIHCHPNCTHWCWLEACSHDDGCRSRCCYLVQTWRSIPPDRSSSSLSTRTHTSFVFAFLSRTMMCLTSCGGGATLDNCWHCLISSDFWRPHLIWGHVSSIPEVSFWRDTISPRRFTHADSVSSFTNLDTPTMLKGAVLCTANWINAHTDFLLPTTPFTHYKLDRFPSSKASKWNENWFFTLRGRLTSWTFPCRFNFHIPSNTRSLTALIEHPTKRANFKFA